MNKVIVAQWRLINKHCIEIGQKTGVELPNDMKVTSGNANQRLRQRLTAISGFLGDVNNSLPVVEADAEVQPVVENSKPTPPKKGRRKK